MLFSTHINIPSGCLAVDDEEAAERRRQLRERLMNGGTVRINPQGEVDTTNSGQGIVIPPGKLAAPTRSTVWYENNPQLYNVELMAMQQFFPHFRLDKLEDGRLFWYGELSVNSIRPGGKWLVQAVYENNHPHNNTYGGSVKIYSIEPDLNELYQELGSIPHILRDSAGQLYMCTAQASDVHASSDRSTTAASALSWAVKWITVFELWCAGDVTTAQFSGHTF